MARFLEVLTDVKQELMDLLVAAPAFANASVLAADPRQVDELFGEIGGRQVAFFAREDQGITPVTIAKAAVSPWHDVMGRLDLVIQVVNDTGDATRIDTEREAAQLADAAITVVEANDPLAFGLGATYPSLGVDVSGYERTIVAWMPQGFAASITVFLDVESRAC